MRLKNAPEYNSRKKESELVPPFGFSKQTLVHNIVVHHEELCCSRAICANELLVHPSYSSGRQRPFDGSS